MPVQAPQWTDFLSCPICTQTFDETIRKPISLGCGHTVCKMCLNKLHRKACPFDQTTINTDIELLPVNSALLQLVGAQVSVLFFFLKIFMLFFSFLLGGRVMNKEYDSELMVCRVDIYLFVD